MTAAPSCDVVCDAAATAAMAASDEDRRIVPGNRPEDGSRLHPNEDANLPVRPSKSWLPKRVKTGFLILWIALLVVGLIVALWNLWLGIALSSPFLAWYATWARKSPIGSKVV